MCFPDALFISEKKNWLFYLSLLRKRIVQLGYFHFLSESKWLDTWGLVVLEEEEGIRDGEIIEK
jgi:hypothetical protein